MEKLLCLIIVFRSFLTCNINNSYEGVFIMFNNVEFILKIKKLKIFNKNIIIELNNFQKN